MRPCLTMYINSITPLCIINGLLSCFLVWFGSCSFWGCLAVSPALLRFWWLVVLVGRNLMQDPLRPSLVILAFVWIVFSSGRVGVVMFIFSGSFLVVYFAAVVFFGSGVLWQLLCSGGVLIWVLMVFDPSGGVCSWQRFGRSWVVVFEWCFFGGVLNMVILLWYFNVGVLGCGVLEWCSRGCVYCCVVLLTVFWCSCLVVVSCSCLWYVALHSLHRPIPRLPQLCFFTSLVLPCSRYDSFPLSSNPLLHLMESSCWKF